jgi:hypothetical protein
VYQRALDATLSFGQRVMEPDRVPIRQRKQLAAMAQQGRQLLQGHRP